MLLPNGLLEIGGLRTILLKIERAHQYGGLQAFAAAKGELSYVARSITFRKTAREAAAKVPIPIADHFSLAPFNAVGERG